LSADGVAHAGGILSHREQRAARRSVGFRFDFDDLLGPLVGGELDVDAGYLTRRDLHVLNAPRLMELVPDAKLVRAGRELQTVAAVHVGGRLHRRADHDDLRIEERLSRTRLGDGAPDDAFALGGRPRGGRPLRGARLCIGVGIARRRAAGGGVLRIGSRGEKHR
jgi:hypothetical protein